MANNGQQHTNTIIHPLCDIEDGALLGNGVTIDRYSCVARGAVIGDGTTLAQCVDIAADAVIGKRVTMDAGVTIAPGTSIGDEAHLGAYVALVPVVDSRAISAPVPGAPITIGRGVRIGDKSTIGPGVTIGEYAIVSPASAVLEDIPPYAVVTGNPARVIGYLCHCDASPVPSADACPSCAGIRDVVAVLDALVG
ncbi:MAG TPA: DapH/DapD/GlmU-related protein [Armatimonadota bacterium]|jgi:acetyltransferase-like isoleucine patch superfamily enzyme